MVRIYATPPFIALRVDSLAVTEGTARKYGERAKAWSGLFS